MNSKFAIAFSSMWFAVAMAVIAGLYFTHSIHCLWFMLVPTMVTITCHSEPGSESNTPEDKPESE